MVKSTGEIEADTKQALGPVPQHFSRILNSHPRPFSSEQASPPERGYAFTVPDALVAQTLDDLEEGHLDLETALHTLARMAFNAGQRDPRPNSDH